MDQPTPDQRIAFTGDEARQIVRFVRSLDEPPPGTMIVVSQLGDLLEGRSLAEDVVVSVAHDDGPPTLIEEDGWVTLRGRCVTAVTRHRAPMPADPEARAGSEPYGVLRRAVARADRDPDVSRHVVIDLDRGDADDGGPDRLTYELKPPGMG